MGVTKHQHTHKSMYTNNQKLKVLVDYAIKTFPERVEQEFLNHFKEFCEEPSSKNAAVVIWLLLAVFEKYGMSKEGGKSIADLEARLSQLVDRLEKTGGLINPEK